MARKSTHFGAIAVSLAAAAAGATALAAPAGAATSAKKSYTAALKAASNEGVHYLSTATEQGTSIRLEGDTGLSNGAETLTLRKGTLDESLAVTLIGSTGYLKGNAAALTRILGLSSTEADAHASRWLSFPSSNTTLAQLVSGLLDKDVASELEIDGPYSFGKATSVDGQSATAIRGTVSASSGTTVPVVLYIQSTGSHRPIEEVTNPGKSAKVIEGTVTFTKWGEKKHFSAPSSSTSLLALSQTDTTTTGG